VVHEAREPRRVRRRRCTAAAASSTCSNCAPATRLARAFVDAAVEAGHRRSDDFNGPEQDGFGLFDLNQRQGVPADSSRAFLHPVLGRANLALITDALVEKVRIENGSAQSA
jgi:choline dehydrogenase-like flavoprotein